MADAGAVTSVGSPVGSCYDNALAESVNGICRPSRASRNAWRPSRLGWWWPGIRLSRSDPVRGPRRLAPNPMVSGPMTAREISERLWSESQSSDRGDFGASEASFGDWLAELKPDARQRALDVLRAWLGGPDEWRELLAVRLARRFAYQPILGDAVHWAEQFRATNEARRHRLTIEVIDAARLRQFHRAGRFLDRIISARPMSGLELVVWFRAKTTKCILGQVPLGLCLDDGLRNIRDAGDHGTLITVLAWLTTLERDDEVTAAMTGAELEEIERRVPWNRCRHP